VVGGFITLRGMDEAKGLGLSRFLPSRVLVCFRFFACFCPLFPRARTLALLAVACALVCFGCCVGDTCTHTHIHTYTHTHIYTYTYTRTHTFLPSLFHLLSSLTLSSSWTSSRLPPPLPSLILPPPIPLLGGGAPGANGVQGEEKVDKGS
jgi:hypothetical protein